MEPEHTSTQAGESSSQGREGWIKPSSKMIPSVGGPSDYQGGGGGKRQRGQKISIAHQNVVVGALVFFICLFVAFVYIVGCFCKTCLFHRSRP